MSLRTPFLLLLLCPSLVSCHVIDRAKECALLSAVFREAGPDLSASPLPPDPDPKALEAVAARYSELKERIEKLALSDEELKLERGRLAQGFSTIDRSLRQAALAVAAHRKKHPSQEERPDPPEPQTENDTNKGLPPGGRPGVGNRLLGPRAALRVLSKEEKDYAQEKRTIEAANRSLTGVLTRLEAACK